MSPTKEWLDFLTATTDARCRKIMQHCASSTCRGEIPLLPVFCVQQLHYRLSCQSKGYNSQTLVGAHTPREDEIGLRREEGRCKEHAGTRLARGSSNWKRTCSRYACLAHTCWTNTHCSVTLDCTCLRWDTALHVFGACSPEALLLIMAVTSYWLLHFWNISLFLV